LGASAFFEVASFPGGEADAEAVNAIANAALNRVAMLLVFITWIVVLGSVPVGRVSDGT
jgi:hypothetical protein